MKNPRFILRLVLVGFLLTAPVLQTLGVVFTNNTAIGPLDSNYDGADIVISNCIVTVDGPHTFASLQVAPGGTLTHSFFSNGVIVLTFNVTNESHVLNGTNPVTLLHTNISFSGTTPLVVTDAGQTTTYSNGVDYVLLNNIDLLGNTTTQIERTEASSIPDGSTVLVSYSWDYWTFAGLNLSVTGDVSVATGGSINANDLGYQAFNYPGPPGPSGTIPGGGNSTGDTFFDGSGAGHGGNGGNSSSNAVGGVGYDSLYQPTMLGNIGGASYVGSGGPGGGAVQIAAGGNVTIDGVISANGADATNNRAGGGSGGSIWISAASVSGTGSITANGGAGAPNYGGGGGGGRIAIQCGTNNFSGTTTAYGGSGWQFGGAGTIFTQLTGQTGLLVVDNGGHSGAHSTLPDSIGPPPMEDFVIRGNAVVVAPSTPDNFYPSNLTINANSLLTGFPADASPHNLAFSVAGNLTVQPGGAITADGLGYNAGSGPGAGQVYYSGYSFCGGGGHGGYGGTASVTNAAGGHAYDSQTAPTTPGSGGGTGSSSIGGAGGGAIQLTVAGVLQVDGTITANGINGSGIAGGGGAGGSIYVTAATLAGSGSITANGGSGADSFGGGGGGGRIAIFAGTNVFAGNIAAAGSGGANYGGAGTIYLESGGTAPQLLLDNADHAGAITPMQSVQGANLIVQNGAVGAATSATFASLLVGSNAWLLPSAPYLNEDFTISGDVTIQAGGGIIADAHGYPANQGPGHGNYSYALNYYLGSGGGHGGYGANSISNAASGGTAGYDSITSPYSAGSGGGGSLPFSVGGSGGGIISMNVSGALRVDGVLSANGGNGAGFGGGGGSGGSLNLTVGSLLGSGVIAADGGNGEQGIGGGGGGGIIAVNLNQSNSFAGTFSAFGGGGANDGGAGTIFINTNFALPPGAIGSLLLVDNAGHRGTNTPINYSSPNSSLVLRNGAVAVPNSPSSFSSLLITSNAWLVPEINTSGTVNLMVNSNAKIQAGGGIVADASGYAQNNGPGAGHGAAYPPWFACSGAGHGGYGALGVTNQLPGGTTYDSTPSPGNVGSGGGGYFTFSVGGAGGGYVHLSVGGVLQLDGVISANGGDGSGAGGGGGSGGSIYISTTKPDSFAGSGSITANGGNGANGGGGGGGGRIAISSLNTPGNSNVFAGIVSAYGGGGANYGGAGTIYYYFQTNFQGYPLVLLDNGNHAGTNTSFESRLMDLTVQNQAIGLIPSGWGAHNILINSNGTLTTLASGNPCFLSANNLTIEMGGALSLDGAGYGPQSGPGAGSGPGAAGGSASRGGGGHGGYGGGNGPNGGSVYDSIQFPTTAGSGGAGTYISPNFYAGAGGGALILNVYGTLTVNGRLSANGTSNGFNNGGGAGGSLNLTTVFNLAGNGVISANGGSASGTAGGGGGGRIALICNSNNFTGQLSAAGGGGPHPGGAGTIYTRVSGLTGAQTLLVDNAGLAGGTNTPLSSAYSLPTTPFDLDISGAATVVPLTPLPLLSNLTVAADSTLTLPFAQSNLFIAVLNNANLAGSLNVDHLGYGQTNGPGAGSAIDDKGSGGGYGGAGGASSSGAPGGAAYGSAAQPADLGSGGGNGANTASGGSDGGGALRLSVAGAINLGGSVSANGNDGLQDDSGGGAGGSVWISAGSLSGAGNISAFGGVGAPLGGGGGGGGRIAIYTPTNDFAGTTNVSGGGGASPGQAGTVFLSTGLAAFQVVSQSPTGLVMNTVSDVDLAFNEALNPASVLTSDFTLVTPAGALAASNLSVAVTGPATVRISFPAQNLLGDYSIQADTALTNIFGLPLASAYVGTFTVSLPTISGAVTDTNGAPVADVLLQPDGGLAGVTTDTNGNYALGVPPGWNGTVTPALGSFMFVPGALAYTNVTVSLTNQNYLMVQTVAPALAAGLNGTNLTVNWAGIPGVTYQLLWSTNLVDWVPVGDTLPGTNGPMQIVLPVGSDPADFFRISAAN